MSKVRPYQPFPLRIIHGVNGVVAILAIISSFLVYNTYDGRLIKLPLPQIPDIIGIHGTLGLIFLLLFPLLALYSFHLGEHRLIQSDSFSKLAHLTKPIGWYSLHRIINTIMLIAATWALITGRKMQEEWLPKGELNEVWYQLHLSAWVILFCCIIVHIFVGIKVGGIPLTLSMFRWGYIPPDSPQAWWHKIRSVFQNRG